MQEVVAAWLIVGLLSTVCMDPLPLSKYTAAATRKLKAAAWYLASALHAL